MLRSNDRTRFRPQLLTVELHGLQLARTGEHRSVQFLQEVGYELISYDRVTALFRRLR